MALILTYGPAYSIISRGIKKMLDTSRRVEKLVSGPDIGSPEYHRERGYNPDGTRYDPNHRIVPQEIMRDAENPQSPDIVYDKYTMSILAEAMSYQLPKSKRESASKFIRPKKKKELLYRQ